MLCSMLWAVTALPTAPSDLPPGWLHFGSTVHAENICAVSVQRSAPHGDIILFDPCRIIWNVLDALAGTQPPDHIGMVVALPDGRLALLESAPNAHLWVYLLDVPGRLHTYKGRILVRPLRCPLSPEQSARLTGACARPGRETLRGLACMRQITPFRARGPLRWRSFRQDAL